VRTTAAAIVLLASLGACAEDPTDDPIEEIADLGVGELGESDGKADGVWGAALTCKPPPNLPVLARPEIIISLDGLTLHLIDRTTGFDKVFPVGVGAIDTDATSLTAGESLSYYPLAAYGKQDFTIKPSGITPCKIWWTDPANGQKLPVFAGMPFMSWSGSYGIHGPIDNYRALDGGSLRRGYVSHGCIRMAGADILEVYARTKGLASIPVHVQREPERTAAGLEIDLAQKWIGAECSADADCNFSGGLCKVNAFGGRGFCTARCGAYCNDRAGQPSTFCVADPDAPGQGMCVAKETAVNSQCRPYDHFVAKTLSRNTQPSVTAKVCVPGSRGWVGDRCVAATDCGSGTSCVNGTCTMSCDKYCSDAPGYADTFCVNDATLGSGGHCARTCTPSSNASECAGEMVCQSEARNGQPSVVKNVCLPE
jgi:hypothetical protein